ncbi:hypothetical protein A8W25_27105 [Streptomyces sp. ERV7]|nr:hypothetical protein A8W25_27105 [Streptomyces sp. ERV7]
MTERPGHAQQLARTAGGPGGPAVLVCVGGDGTAHEIMTGLLAGREERRAALLVLPGGRGNSFYRELWSDRPWPAALEAALSAPRVRHVDLARIAETGELALLGASSGLAAQALTSVRDALGTGRRRYQTAVARTMLAFRPYRGRVSVDGVVVQSGETVSVLVGGGRRRGGQFMPLPRSVLDDGLLDICVAGAELPLREMVRLARDGSHVGHEGVVYTWGRVPHPPTARHHGVMTQPTETPVAPPDPDPGPVPAAPQLRRSGHNKVIGGVCGGLGRYCDIDPVIFRVALGVLTVTGGLGLVFYGFGWLLLPLDDEDENEARRLLSGRVEGPALAAVLMALAGCGIFLSMLNNGSVMSFAGLLTVAVAGIGVWSQRRSVMPPDAPPDAVTAQTVGGTPSPRRSPSTTVRRSAAERALPLRSPLARPSTVLAARSAPTAAAATDPRARTAIPPSAAQSIFEGWAWVVWRVKTTAAVPHSTAATAGSTAVRSSWGRMRPSVDGGCPLGGRPAGAGALAGAAGGCGRCAVRPCRPPSRRSDRAAGARR